jgi:type IV pilus assembly protein PilC
MKFIYVAKNRQGETVTGIAEAVSEDDLAENLKAQSLLLISSEHEKEGIGSFDVNKLFAFFRGISRLEKITFTRNLSVMINAGIPLTRSLQTLANQAGSPAFKDVILNIASNIAKGKSFGDSLKEYPDVFPNIFVSMVVVGETTGNLDEVLEILTEQMVKDNETRSKVIGAMIYPAVIITAMLGIGIFMMVYVVPMLTGIFTEMNVELPFMTKVVIGISNFLQNSWYYGLGGLVLLIYLLKTSMSLPAMRKTVDFIILKLPIVGNMVIKINSARISRNMSSLLKSGMSLTRSLEILSSTASNYFFSESLLRAKDGVEKGLTLSETLQRYKNLYPPMVLEMMAIGEETGALTDLLVKVAVFYEKEVDQITKNMASIIEPVLMVLMGGAVGFFAVSMIQPMYQISSGIK